MGRLSGNSDGLGAPPFLLAHDTFIHLPYIECALRRILCYELPVLCIRWAQQNS